MLKRCLIIGLGQIGMGYDYENCEDILTHANGITAHPNFELIGGVDSSGEKRELFTKKFNKPSYADIYSALKASNADIIIVATPAETHLDVINAILETARPDAILCEKPLAHDLDQAKSIVEVCKSSGVDLFTNFIRRSEPGAIAIRDMIENNEIEVPIKGICWYSKGIYNTGSHFINLSEFWLGKFRSSKLIRNESSTQFSEPEPDFIVSFEKGSVVFQSLKDQNFSYYTIELLSQSGRLFYGLGGDDIKWQNVNHKPNATENNSLNPIPELIPSNVKKYQWHVYNQLWKYYYSDTWDISTGEDALKTAIVIEDLKRQMKI